MASVVFAVSALVFLNLFQGINSETFYHYTDISGGDAIKSSGYIMRAVIAAYGDGVYLTKMSPHLYSAVEIAMNNWRSNNTSRTKRIYQLQISSNVKDVGTVDRRDIWLYTDGNLYLNKTNGWSYLDWPSGNKGNVQVLASVGNQVQNDRILCLCSILVSFTLFRCF